MKKKNFILSRLGLIVVLCVLLGLCGCAQTIQPESSSISVSVASSTITQEELELQAKFLTQRIVRGCLTGDHKEGISSVKEIAEKWPSFFSMFVYSFVSAEGDPQDVYAASIDVRRIEENGALYAVLTIEQEKSAVSHCFGIENWVPTDQRIENDDLYISLEVGFHDTFTAENLEVISNDGEFIQVEFDLATTHYDPAETSAERVLGRYVITYQIIQDQLPFLRFYDLKKAV
jgi:hypothetical protein